MIPSQRQHRIIELLNHQEIMSINELVDMFKVSHMTIRRDLQKLEKNGIVVLVSGGVRLPERLQQEPSHKIKEQLNANEKSRIANSALRFISKNSCIFLDAGTTNLYLAKQIAVRDDLTIITNDFVITNYLIQHSSSHIIHIGGSVDKSNHSTVGNLAANTIRQNFLIDKAFISSSSWNLKGISTPHEEKVPVKTAIRAVSQQAILLCDTSKYGKIGMYLALELNLFDHIITDKNLPESAKLAIEEKGITLTLV